MGLKSPRKHGYDIHFSQIRLLQCETSAPDSYQAVRCALRVRVDVPSQGTSAAAEYREISTYDLPSQWGVFGMRPRQHGGVNLFPHFFSPKILIVANPNHLCFSSVLTCTASDTRTLGSGAADGWSWRRMHRWKGGCRPWPWVIGQVPN